MSKYEPARLTERLVDACVGACIAVGMAVSALYVTVWLLAQIWLWVLGLGIVAGACRLWWLRRQRW